MFEFKFDLNMVDTIKLQNGHEYFKFINSNGETVFLENMKLSESLEEQMNKLSLRFNIQIGNNPQENTMRVLEFMSKNIKSKLKMFPIKQLDMNEPFIQNLPEQKKNEIMVLMINNQKYNLNIEYINIDEAIGITADGKVYDAEMINGIVQIQGVQNVNKTTLPTAVENNNQNQDNKDSLYQEAINRLAGGEEVVSIDGVLINKSNVDACLSSLSLDSISLEEKPIYQQLISKLNDAIVSGQVVWKYNQLEEAQKNNTRQYVKKDNIWKSESAYINKSYLTIVFGFVVCIILIILSLGFEM